ncbi:hypothetical protein LEP1GSC165_1928 [Leptospira santarosai str. CBC523]|nr:hypothetical protein LEP1GSC165_1928 [Leptospira santarosai str. CBC523]
MGVPTFGTNSDFLTRTHVTINTLNFSGEFSAVGLRNNSRLINQSVLKLNTIKNLNFRTKTYPKTSDEKILIGI